MKVKWQMKLVRWISVIVYIVSWVAFTLGFIMYYPILDHIRRLQIMNTAGAMILFPMSLFSIPGLVIGVLITFHLISRRTDRKYIYLAVIMFCSIPYLCGGGVTVFLASAFLGTTRYNSTRANGVAVEWVYIVLLSSFTSIGAYWLSVTLAILSSHKKSLYVSRELIRTSEYERLN